MNLRSFRTSRNLTQLEFAKLINVKRTTVSMWENNKSLPNIDMLKKIAQVLNCTVDDLIKEGWWINMNCNRTGY